jgi:hypothetical protein
VGSRCIGSGPVAPCTSKGAIDTVIIQDIACIPKVVVIPREKREIEIVPNVDFPVSFELVYIVFWVKSAMFMGGETEMELTLDSGPYFEDCRVFQ